MTASRARLSAATCFGVLAACSSNSTLGVPTNSASGVATVTLASGEHVVSAGARMIRFGGAARNATNTLGWISLTTKNKALLYGSSYDGGFINIYDEKGKYQHPIGQLTNGLTSPQGIAVDTRHRLWVANTNAFDVVAFKRGATAPFATLRDPGYYPVSVAVDLHGTVYAANSQGASGEPGNVTFWKSGASNPSGTLAFSKFNIIFGLGIDARDDVYVSYIPSKGGPELVVFPSGSHDGRQISIVDASASDIVFDSSANLVMAEIYGGLAVWAPPYSGLPLRKLPIYGSEPVLDAAETGIWAANGDKATHAVDGYDYNRGYLFDTIPRGFSSSAPPYGVAVDPPAKL